MHWLDFTVCGFGCRLDECVAVRDHGKLHSDKRDFRRDLLNGGSKFTPDPRLAEKRRSQWYERLRGKKKKSQKKKKEFRKYPNLCVLRKADSRKI